MNITKKITSLTLICVTTLLLSSCATTKHANDFSGLTTPNGDATYISHHKYALHFFFGVVPLIGDASIEQTVAEFSAKAKNDRASKIRIVQSRKLNWWFIFPPISFLLTPVSSNVAGDAIR